MIAPARGRVVAILGLGTLTLAACTTGSSHAPPTPPTAPHTVGSNVTQSSPAPATTPTSTAPESTSKAPPTRTGTAHPTPTATKLPADYCAADQLTMRVLPGGAFQGYEVDAVTFTNHSSASCSLSGFPSVQLERNGQLLASASSTAHQPGLVHIAPGAQAEAQLRDHSTCQAPLSDTIHVVAPGPLAALHLDSTASFVQLRGCTVTVDPIVLSS
ncbi:MAG: DUF4232 domain-containing protein [Jatrophihabitantaceae bacterium]